jgi:hypothetical protein
MFIDFEKSAAYHNSQVYFTVEVFAVIVPYEARFGSYLTTFRDSLSATISRVQQSKNSAGNRWKSSYTGNVLYGCWFSGD